MSWEILSDEKFANIILRGLQKIIDIYTSQTDPSSEDTEIFNPDQDTEAEQRTDFSLQITTTRIVQDERVKRAEISLDQEIEPEQRANFNLQTNTTRSAQDTSLDRPNLRRKINTSALVNMDIEERRTWELISSRAIIKIAIKIKEQLMKITDLAGKEKIQKGNFRLSESIT